jgi:hypothetical protein
LSQRREKVFVFRAAVVNTVIVVILNIRAMNAAITQMLSHTAIQRAVQLSRGKKSEQSILSAGI